MKLIAAATLILMTTGALAQVTTTRTIDLTSSIAKLTSELVQKHGEPQRPRIERGLRQTSSFWRAEDGDAAAYEAFVRANFAGDQKTLDETFNRFLFLLESLDGHMHEITRDFRRQSDVELGTILPLDEVIAGYDPSAHINEDFFRNKVAFVALLNFPVTTLDERLANGEKWTRRQWAETRLAQRFARRVPADVNQAIAKAAAEGEQYISGYNIWMHHVLNEKGERLFPAKKRLLSHWNLRDEIKANYGDPKSGLEKQRLIQKVMERIVTQTIPASVIDNPRADWKPVSNAITASTIKDYEEDRPAPPISNAPEADRRYEVLLNTYKAARLQDPYSPTAPTLIARRFNEDREIPEARVRAIFEQILSSPMVPQVARRIEKRLGRKLEPFDIWYNGFRPKLNYTEAQLDEITAKKYPDAAAFQAGIPDILMKLGFSKERAEYLARNIEVDAARGSGHAMGAARRGDKAHLRTRVEATGMNYKGYNIAVHELGHNVEQTFGLNDIDYITLQGVPNTAFTEALAFVFQAKDLELLGLSKPDAESQALKALNDFWATYEIAGVAMVDMGVWQWMYANPNATPAQLKAATLDIAKNIWNKYYAPVFNQRDVVLLGIYSHMIDAFLYLPDYPLGHLIAFQIEEKMEQAGSIGPEFERVSRIGRVTPDHWMKQATGAPVSADALLHATEKALKVVR